MVTDGCSPIKAETMISCLFGVVAVYLEQVCVCVLGVWSVLRSPGEEFELVSTDFVLDFKMCR